MPRAFLISLVVALAACAPGSQRFREGDLRPAANPGQVIATERAFARMAREKGTWTAFRRYATDDALWPSPGLVGVQQSLKDTPDPAQPVIWGPDAAWSSCDGSLAVTTGEAMFPSGRKSRFLTVWQRQSDGEIVWCEVCREQKRKRRVARYHQRKEAGLCVECGSESGGKSRCESCRADKHEYRITRYYGRKESGLCVECGAKSDGLTRCERCRLANKVRECLCVD